MNEASFPLTTINLVVAVVILRVVSKSKLHLTNECFIVNVTDVQILQIFISKYFAPL